MVLEISNLFGETVDGITGNDSPFKTIVSHPIGIAVIIVVLIVLIYYSIYDEDSEFSTNDIVKTSLYMITTTAIAIYVHDHVACENIKVEQELLEDEDRMPDVITDLDDNNTILNEIRNNLNPQQSDTFQ